VVATAGSVDTGAIDDLAAVADVAKANDLWLHVDGAFGALGALVPELAPRLHGIERADSPAFDLHKWAQVTYECGCVLVRDGELHRRTFAAPASYLGTAARGLAGGAPWFCDFGPELSRGFRALKAWFLFTEHGAEAIADAIRRTCMLAEYLASRVREDARLELLAAHGLNIVCFRVRPPPGEDADCFNARLVEELQMSGAAAPSTAHIRGVLAIRCCIVNHRTKRKDIDILLRAIARIVARSAPRRPSRGAAGTRRALVPRSRRKARRPGAREALPYCDLPASGNGPL
jgi:glutamate/tyrosine decarboxylase-like PLP-dependent enzyme